MAQADVFRSPAALPDAADKTTVVAALRARIAAVEETDGVEAAGCRRTVPLGADPVDRHLPGGGLAPDGIHEVAAETYGDLPAALGFCAGLAMRFMHAQSRGSVVWCARGAAGFDFGAVYGPGLAALGFDPARLLAVEATNARDLLWTLEQAARLPGLAAVIGETGQTNAYDLTASRRLQLAAREGGVPVMVLRGHGGQCGGSSAALTRWRIAVCPAPGCHVGTAAWTVGLERARGVPPGRWRLIWDPALKSFAMPAPAAGPAQRSRIRSPTAAAGGGGLGATG